MNIVCLDMEGVLVPEIWIEFAEASGIPELTRTTRDEPDYDKLMNWRIDLLNERGMGLPQIQDVIATIEPLVGSALGILAYGESVGIQKIAGMVLILLAVVLASSEDKEQT